MSRKKKDIKIQVQRKQFPNNWLLYGGLVALIPLGLVVTLMILLFSTSRIYPNVSVAGVDIGLLNREQAFDKISREMSQRGSQTLSFELNTASISAKQVFEVRLSSQETASSVTQAVDKAYRLGRSQTFFPKANIDLDIKPSLAIKQQVTHIAQAVNQEAIDSTLKIDEGGITVTPSQAGLILDEERIYSEITDYFNGKAITNPNLPLKLEQPKLSFNEALSIKKRLDEIKVSPLKLTFDDQTFIMDLSTILSLIDVENSKNSLALISIGDQTFNISSFDTGGKKIEDGKLTLDKDKLDSYLKNIAGQIDRPVQEPLFFIDPASSPDQPKITEFRPPLEGRELDINKAHGLIAAALIAPSQTQIQLPVNIVLPKNKLANELGIKELIGQGESNFAGSIENRIYNVKLAASRINGVIIDPGEEFSFVKTVGDITAATGYKQAYVIKSGRTVLDDGGGVCQVSTTLFRAALNTGLPITARTAHAYRVSYYEQGYPPGLDATVFYPSVDLKFKNDTAASILIQAYVTGLRLTVDLYGTSDGRIVSLTKPVINSVTPAPPEIRQDDPSLPRGTVKQVDWAANGANVVFSRKVIRGGVEVINETFRSNFRPWQAVYLVGTKEG